MFHMWNTYGGELININEDSVLRGGWFEITSTLTSYFIRQTRVLWQRQEQTNIRSAGPIFNAVKCLLFFSRIVLILFISVLQSPSPTAAIWKHASIAPLCLETRRPSSSRLYLHYFASLDSLHLSPLLL